MSVQKKVIAMYCVSNLIYTFIYLYTFLFLWMRPLSLLLNQKKKNIVNHPYVSVGVTFVSSVSGCC